MTGNITSRTIWNEAGKAGIALGGTVIVCSLLSSLIGQLNGGTMVKFFLSVFGFILWAVKFGGCMWLMAYFMKKLVADYDDVTNQDTYRLGVASALLSGLIVAAFTLASVMYITPEAYLETFQTAMQQALPTLDSNSQEIFDSLTDNLPVIMFISNLLYCFIYGWILSFILSRNIPSSNPFAKRD